MNCEGCEYLDGEGSLGLEKGWHCFMFMSRPEHCAWGLGPQVEQATASCLSELLCAEYVRCRYCDSNFSQQSGFGWVVVEKKEPNCVHQEAHFICPACGFENRSFVFRGSE